MRRIVYSTDRKRVVALAREAGYSDYQIMKQLLAGEAGVTHRKRVLLEWADALGAKPSEILRAAARSGLIPNDRMPKG
ncbi:MAG: hypothetical protein ACE5HB_04395 [Terriglobia bacterium]